MRANCIPSHLPVLTFLSGTLSEAREFFQPLHVQSRTVSVHVPGQEFSTNKEQEFVGRASTFHISEASSVQFLLETASGLRSSIALLVGSPPRPQLDSPKWASSSLRCPLLTNFWFYPWFNQLSGFFQFVWVDQITNRGAWGRRQNRKQRTNKQTK